MSKKLITAALALVALTAFVAPSVASASPEVTHPTGTTMAVHPTGTTCTAEPKGCITATSIGETRLKDTAGNILTTCSSATMTGILTKNNGTEIEGDIESTTFNGTGAAVGGDTECTGSFGNITVDTNLGEGTPWCIKATKAMEADEFQVIGGNCGSPREITFVMTSTTVGTCKYTRETKTNPIKGTFTTHSTGDAILSLLPNANTAFTKEEGGFLCPSEGTLEMTFTLETDNSKAKEPLYIS